MIRAVAVEKLGFPKNWLKTDDQKCIRIRRKSFIANRSATIFRRDLREGVFQQLLALSQVIPEPCEAPVQCTPSGRVSHTALAAQDRPRQDSVAYPLPRV